MRLFWIESGIPRDQSILGPKIEPSNLARYFGHVHSFWPCIDLQAEAEILTMPPLNFFAR
jgi:hypothetical protein